MQNYEIPRNYRGEGRILYIFSTKALIYTVVGAAIGLLFYFIITIIFAAIGFVIATFKVPETSGLKISKKVGGEKIDDVIMRWIKFKKDGKKIYIYKDEEETKDEQ